MTTAITYAALKTFETTPRVLVLPAPDNVVWNQGIEEQIIQERNQLGELQITEAIVNSKQPAATISYGKMTKEIMALKLGFRLQNQSITDALMAGSFRVEKLSYPAAVSGQEGFGMVADQTTSEMYVLRNGISTPLTRQAFGTFNAATNDTFAQGINGATLLSNNLLTTPRTLVTRFFFYPVTDADVMTEDPFSDFQCTLIGVLTEQSQKKVFEVKFNSMQLNKTDNNEIDFQATPIPIAFRITDLSCAPRLRFFNRLRQC